MRIPVARPQLPRAEVLLQYLHEIDGNRIYSNFGPVSELFEQKLASHLGLPDKDGCVATVANGTLGLTLALQASGTVPGSLCLMPAWTFVATAHAAVAAGLVPYLADVDAASWALDADRTREMIRRASGRVGAVVPVLPFGSPAEVGAWDELARDTGVPVVIDAAAAFDGLVPGESPAVVSLHATKVLGAGEGGLVVSTRSELIEDIRRRMNFGFHARREAEVAALNAKMSEYHAAVGLAGIAEWQSVRKEFREATLFYVEALSSVAGIHWLPGYGTEWVSSTCVVGLSRPVARELAAALAARGIDSRSWYGGGLHRHAAFAQFPRDELPVTERLAESTLGLPLFRGITREQVGEVAGIVAGALS